MEMVPSLKRIGYNECCGCAGCMNICPVDAITMEENESGFLLPVLNESKCIHCSRCIHVCPVINAQTKEDSPVETVLVGYSKEEETVQASSSGGFFSVIAKGILEKRGQVVGVKWEPDFKSVNHVIVNRLEDLWEVQLSKYIQSDKGYVYRDIIHNLKAGEHIAFVGCPCEVAALMCQVPPSLCSNLYTIDLVCQGPTSRKAMREFVDYIEEKESAHIQSINMRHAIGPWIPQYLKIKFDDGKVYINRLYDTVIGDAIRIMQREACYKCVFAGKGRRSDLTLGDYHGAQKNASYYHESGISIAVAHTEKGVALLERLKESNIYYETGNYEEIAKYNPRIEKAWKPLPEYQNYKRAFDKGGLIYASNQVISKKKRIIRKLPIKARFALEKLRKAINR